MENKNKKILSVLTSFAFIFFLMQALPSGAQEASSCEKALELIGKAVKLYQAINGKLPDKLSELWSRGLVRNFEDFLCPGSETVIETTEDIDQKSDFEIPVLTSQEGIYPVVAMKAKEGRPRLAFRSDGSLGPYAPEAVPVEREQPRQPTETTTQPETTTSPTETERETPTTTSQETTTPTTQPDVPTTETERETPTTTIREPAVTEESERPAVDRPTPETTETETEALRREQPRQPEEITSETAPSIPDLPQVGAITPAGRGPLSHSTALIITWILAVGILIMLALTIFLIRRRGVLAAAGPQSSSIDLNLEITDPAGNVQKVTLTSAPSEIGRDPKNDITLDDPSVSRRHAKIVIKDGRLWLIDLSGSENTLINGKSTSQAEIFQDSVIELGSTRIRVL